ncbi:MULTISPECIES: RagB/SusD family nutrient uptake outer membrane protein [unclassified Imperialibacter]|uniref:RagB/SusD family nutrient uptake outer membrane protein n=1 Tax=unclassified Imperialibacter TaxID=2629706 RepID=UPI00125481DC|nr:MULTISPECIES: RagB/SusD family nutrient uptake outer membrane protein [unclassified Imperialibacter]CAD5278617.1 putative outer membrane starch-binding protein [Imperialibacter sp. 89]CAD5292763.1 putative outer membrane starch-binding protein [Imperialibacter sp. 75]VVS99473.1 Starch-binding associating with outer membrane [Imperialibacter sp. EC-SDR9]
MRLNIYKTFLVLIVMAMASACQKDLLETVPDDRLSAESFWKTERDAVLAVNAVYPNCLDAGDRLFMFDAFTDIGHTNSFFSANAQVEQNVFDASNSVIATLWTELYQGIASANFVLDNLDKIPTADQALINRVRGEAKALRAYQYIKLATRFGDVPLVTKVLSIDEGKALERTSIDTIWDFIDDELSEAADLLPVSYTPADLGRVTKGAAFALQARANLYAGRYQAAADAAEKVIDLGVYQIYPEYGTLFSYSAEGNSEVILDRQYVKSVLPNNIFGTMAPYGQLGRDGANTYVPTKALADMYTMANGRETTEASSGFDATTPYEGRDPRLRFTLYVPGDIMPNGQVFNSLPNSGTADAVGGTFFATTTGFTLRKYVNSEDAANPTNNGINVILIRYAEVVLTYAEARIELGLIDETTVNAINEVRQRGDVNLPAIALGTSQTELRDIVRKERTVELAFEGLRLNDIRRWGIGEQVIPGAVGGIDYVEEGEIKTYVVPSFQKQFNPSRDYLWPIPYTERILSPNLSQNPNW